MKQSSSVSNGDQSLLEVVLDSWDRNNSILLNLLRALPPSGLEARATEGGPSVAEFFTHVHFVRLVLVSEDAPEFAVTLPEAEWIAERDARRIAEMLTESARVVREAVRSRVQARQEMELLTIIPFSCCNTCSGTRATITGRSSWP